MARRRSAVDLLQADHDRVRGLLDRLAQTTERAVKSRRKLLHDLEREMEAHSRLEKEIVYPAFREAARDRDDEQAIFEFLEEHHLVDDVELPDLLHIDPGTIEFTARTVVLENLLLHHMAEEEARMFPRIQELFDEDELLELGGRMRHQKRELVAQQKKAA
jgi:iron-sulfur cluster repair protein YtfE (RIC family)